MNSYVELASKLVLLVPSYLSNTSPLIVRKFLKRVHPVDFGRNFLDGRRVFGDSKSWEGLLAGVLVGMLSGVALLAFYHSSLHDLAIAGLVQGVGSMLGDLANSFLKRRLGLKPGSLLPVLDQTSFILVSLLLVKLLKVDLRVGVELGLIELVVAITLALVLHPIANYVAYLAKLKEVPY
ncbi:MAG: CDP-2,3-bis-(O-geranylgeranyl)-sn-glycerol synthase [Sulfolobales archaeon]|nr:CDP-2,3-bis-(O-geranylgeranyl)-sn-glycerol synthase [Sulfolobales archaeon]MDW8010290.1 CDP-2,3-bis-(O-geranylgeranyl)-sn-glycerol synthase [Sulfolobales archaeon]